MIANSPATLLQEFTRHKLDSALETVEGVRSKSHPFPEGVKALDGISRHLKELRERVIRKLPTAAITQNYCRVALEQLAETVPLIGFIDRSTEVDGPVEFHDPFSRIVRRLLGEDAKLILSSMWNFSPYTIVYPDEVPKYVENFVYVSFSVTESDNAILTPLAAHELGHNVWKKEDISTVLKPKVGQRIVELIQSTYASKWSLAGGVTSSPGDLVGQAAWHPAHFWAMKQLEESFCDFVGLYLFGPSYLYAFAHFIAPGLNAGEQKYPQASERFAALLSIAEVSWQIDGAFTAGLFEHAVRPPDIDNSRSKEVLLQLADDTRRHLTDFVAQQAKHCIGKAGLLYSDADEVKLRTHLNNGVPCIEAGSLMEIVNAGWRVFIDRFYRSSQQSNWGFPLSDTPKVLNELILKSFEIHDIEQRLKEAAPCLMQQKLAL